MTTDGGSPSTETVTVSFELEFGQAGANTSEDSCIFRPFRRFISTGSKIGQPRWLCVACGETTYVLGALCYSPERMLVFYPGVLGYVAEYPGGVLPERFAVDHFTLIPNMTSWHMTDRSGKRIGKYKTSRLGDTTYWFGLSIRQPELLEKALHENAFVVAASSTDITRRARLVRETQGDQTWHLLNVGDRPSRGGSCEYLHFQFLVVGAGGFSIRFLVTPPRSASPHQGDIPATHATIAFDGATTRVAVFGAWIEGTLGGDCFVSWLPLRS